MFGIGGGELLLILVIALFVLGPERMPRMARDIGRVVGDLRKTSDELREEFLNADREIKSAIDAAGKQPVASTISPAPSLPAAADASAAGDRGAGVPGREATAPSTDETPFDREMREARERLSAQGESAS